MVCDDVDWINVAWIRNHWPAPVNGNNPSCLLKRVEIRDLLNNH